MLSVLLSFAIPVFVHRNSYARAVVNYTNNPSVENEAILKAERSENQRVVWTTHSEAAGVIFILMNVGWFLIRGRSGIKSTKAS